jgi:hypothetical protein
VVVEEEAIVVVVVVGGLWCFMFRGLLVCVRACV